MFRRDRALIVTALFAIALSLISGCSKANKNSMVNTPAAPEKRIAVDNSKMSLRNIMQRRDMILSYIMTTNDGDRSFTLSMTTKDGKPYRSKVDLGEKIMYIMFDKKEEYLYDTKTKSAVKMPLKGSSAENPSAVPANKDMEAAKSPVITSGSIDGVDCWLVTYEDAKGKKIQSWLDKEYGLPRQEKIGEKVVKHTYKDINQVPDADFELPSDAKITDMGAMMKK